MTNSRKHLVEMLEHLVNEDEEKARLAFHEFVVQTARQIHESILEDDELEENIEEMKHDYGNKDEEYYGKKDMDEMEGEEELDMDLGDAEAEEELGGEEELDMELDADMDGEEAGEVEEVEVSKDAVVDVMDSMEELQAKFNELLGGAEEELDGEEEMDYDAEEGDVDMEVDAEVEEGMYEDKKAKKDDYKKAKKDDYMDEDKKAKKAKKDDYMDEDKEAKKAKKDEYMDESGDSAGHGANDPSKAGVDSAGNTKKMNEEEVEEETVEEAADSAFDFDLTEEDFQDLEEGLRALDVKMGGEQGGNKFAGEETQTKSPVAKRDMSDVKAGAKDLLSTKDDHDGFKLETAPSNTDLPHAGDNSRDDAEKGREGISGHGGLESQKGRADGEAGAGKFAGTEGNVQSPIGSKGSREGR